MPPSEPAAEPSAGDEYEALQRRSFGKSNRATSESLDEGRRMNGAAIARFLADKRYAAVATTRRDGRPHAAMTGFFADGTVVWLPVMKGTARAANVRAQPYAAVVVSDGEGDEHTVVMLEGPASVVDEPPDDTMERWEARTGSRPDWAVAWIRVDGQRLFSYAGDSSRYSG